MLPGLRVFKHVLRGFSYMNLGRTPARRSLLPPRPRTRPATARSPTRACWRCTTTSRSRRSTTTRSWSTNSTSASASTAPRRCSCRRHRRRASGRERPSGSSNSSSRRSRRTWPASITSASSRCIHAKEYDAAADTLSRLLNPETPGYHPVVRKHVLFDAWDLALRLHPKLVERLGLAAN